MPVTSEQVQEKPRRGRGWLCVLVGLLALVLLLPAVPLLCPVSLGLGGHVVVTETKRILPGSLGAPPPFYSFDARASSVWAAYIEAAPDGRAYRIEGPIHMRGF